MSAVRLQGPVGKEWGSNNFQRGGFAQKMARLQASTCNAKDGDENGVF